MEPVIMVGGNQVFRSGNDKVFVMAEPEAVQDEGVEPVHHAPKGVCREASTPERRAAVDIAYQQPQHDAEDGHSCNLLHVKSHASGPIGLIHQPQRLAALDDCRRIIEDDFHRVPGHQEHEEREDYAGYEGFDKEDHSYASSCSSSEG